MFNQVPEIPVPSPQPAQLLDASNQSSPERDQVPEVPAQSSAESDQRIPISSRPAIKIIRKIAETENSSVYEAMVDNKRVALKKDMEFDVRIEADYLNKAAHPNILKCQGVIRHEGVRMMSMEYMNRGDLGTYLEKNNTRGASQNPERALFMRDFLRGLVYLHTINLVHRDIKCHNILLSSSGGLIAKICDFAFAREIDSGKNYYQSQTLRGTAGCAAPEVFESHKIRTTIHGSRKTMYVHRWTKEADVYGAGVVLLMTACDNKLNVYDGVGGVKNISHLNQEGKIPEIHPEVSKPVRDLILWCFKPLGERPTSAQLLEKFEAIQHEKQVNTTTTSATQPSL